MLYQYQSISYENFKGQEIGCSKGMVSWLAVRESSLIEYMYVNHIYSTGARDTKFSIFCVSETRKTPKTAAFILSRKTAFCL